MERQGMGRQPGAPAGLAAAPPLGAKKERMSPSLPCGSSACGRVVCQKRGQGRAGDGARPVTPLPDHRQLPLTMAAAQALRHAVADVVLPRRSCLGGWGPQGRPGPQSLLETDRAGAPELLGRCARRSRNVEAARPGRSPAGAAGPLCPCCRAAVDPMQPPCPPGACAAPSALCSVRTSLRQAPQPAGVPTTLVLAQRGLLAPRSAPCAPPRGPAAP